MTDLNNYTGSCVALVGLSLEEQVCSDDETITGVVCQYQAVPDGETHILFYYCGRK